MKVSTGIDKEVETMNSALPGAVQSAEAVADALSEESEICTYKFDSPVEYDGKKIETLHFNFTELTGKDALAIDKELRSLGKVNLGAPALDNEYLMRLCVRACKEEVGYDIFEVMKMRDFLKITGLGRSFLLRGEW